MKMNSRTRTFAKQVQVDLLALSDSDLCQTVQQWVDGEVLDAEHTLPVDGLSLLGYTSGSVEQSASVYDTPLTDGLATEKKWLAPSPQHLRTLLTDMDVKVFIQYVIPLAFLVLHPTYPEWGEGLTFNAHLANHLRLISMKSTQQHKKTTAH